MSGEHEEQLRTALTAVSDLQKDGCWFPCPRCGREMRVPILYNCLSRHESIYQNERENLGFESGDDSEYFILPVHYKKASTINRKGAASS